jgi:hypothetical protein
MSSRHGAIEVMPPTSSRARIDSKGRNDPSGAITVTNRGDRYGGRRGTYAMKMTLEPGCNASPLNCVDNPWLLQKRGLGSCRLLWWKVARWPVQLSGEARMRRCPGNAFPFAPFADLTSFAVSN